MQERRTTIRIPHRARIQYCPAEDFLPRDGRILNVSEQGAGILIRRAHQTGERMTVSFPLPGEDDDPLIATGVVRWIGPRLFRNRWVPMGLEWLPPDDVTRHRLHRFLYTSAQALGKVRPPASLARGRWSAAKRIVVGLVVISLLLSALVGFNWLRAFQEEHRRLGIIAEGRRQRIAHLEQQEDRLTTELATTQQSLQEAMTEMARLDQQARGLGADVGQLRSEIDGVQRSYETVQRSYATIREERQQLMQRVLDLEQDRAQLAKRLSSVTDLRLAITEAIQRRKDEPQAQRLFELRTQRLADEEALAQGNRGFVIRDGQPTITGSTVWIKVRDPEF